MARTRATAVVIKVGTILMIHRHNHGEEYYVLPGGGVDNGESLEEAAIRELQEETSIEAKLGEKLMEFTDEVGDSHALYSFEYVSGDPELASDSVEALSTDEEQHYSPEWVPVEKIRELTIYPSEEKDFLIRYIES